MLYLSSLVFSDPCLFRHIQAYLGKIRRILVFRHIQNTVSFAYSKPWYNTLSYSEPQAYSEPLYIKNPDIFRALCNFRIFLTLPSWNWIIIFCYPLKPWESTSWGNAIRFESSKKPPLTCISFYSNKYIPFRSRHFYACISSRFTKSIHVVKGAIN